MSEGVVIDVLGTYCPVPVTNLAKQIEQVPVGAEVVLLADDPSARVDIPVWCRMRAQEFLGCEAAERGWRFRVRRTR